MSIDERGMLLDDEPATERFAARMAAALATGTPLVLYLHGDLGAGKTTIARGMLRAMGEQGAVRSPTYGLVAEYAPAGRRVMHLDLYRLQSPDELLSLGLADYLPDSQLWLIEWPEQAQGQGLPLADAGVFLEPESGGRRVRLVPYSTLGARWVTAVYAHAG